MQLPKTILIVDDNIDMLELLRMYLRDAGHTIAVAEDGNEALRAIEAQCPDLLITDLRMPNGDGLELIERLRAKPELNEMPILVLTANGDGKSHKARDAGANVVMRKPVDFDSVKDVVKELLKSYTR